MTKFDSLGLSDSAREAVDVLGYTDPTPVQEQAIPLVLEGRDIIAGAQTGTGKTAAFCLPCMGRMKKSAKKRGPFMLVVTPTRELADQIGDVCTQISKVTRHRVTTVVGGVSYNPQRQAIKSGTHVLIATPGRLEDLMGQDAVSLDQVDTLVIDEADRMLDMGFWPSVKRIVDACTAPHQTLLFSATIDDRVEQISKDILNDPARVEIARRGDVAETVDHYIVRISHVAKPSALKAIFAEKGANRVIVFARTRHRADACARRINKLGYKAEALHSDKSQAARRKALEAFSQGKVNVLVATDVLARGIDVDQVDYVVNYDMPMQPEDYIHRIGRTGRAGSRGYAISLVSPETEENLKEVQKLIKMEIPVLELDFDRDAAEAEAETRSMQLKARREKDPEVEAVITELAAKKRKERKQKAKAEAAAAEYAKLKAELEEDHLARSKKKRNPKKVAAAPVAPKSRKPKDVAAKKAAAAAASPSPTEKPTKPAKAAKPAKSAKSAKAAKAIKATGAAKPAKFKQAAKNGKTAASKTVSTGRKAKPSMGKAKPSMGKAVGKKGSKAARSSARPAMDMRPGRSRRAASASRKSRG